MTPFYNRLIDRFRARAFRSMAATPPAPGQPYPPTVRLHLRHALHAWRPDMGWAHHHAGVVHWVTCLRCGLVDIVYRGNPWADEMPNLEYAAARIEAVRQFLADHPDASVEEIMAAREQWEALNG